jgi:hypothetical protein
MTPYVAKPIREVLTDLTVQVARLEERVAQQLTASSKRVDDIAAAILSIETKVAKRCEAHFERTRALEVRMAGATAIAGLIGVVTGWVGAALLPVLFQRLTR